MTGTCRSRPAGGSDIQSGGRSSVETGLEQGEVAVVDPVSLIVAALAAGALAGAQGTATDAVKDAYVGMKALVLRRFGKDSAGATALEKHERKPDAWQDALRDELEEAGAGTDTALIAQAHELMALLDAPGPQLGKYRVSIVGSWGTQVGDRNFQINSFTDRPPA